MKKLISIVSILATVVAFGATPTTITNDANTAVLTKFGKIKTTDYVVTGITSNVLTKGVMTWTDDEYDEVDPPDGIWGIKFEHVKKGGGVHSYTVIDQNGFEQVVNSKDGWTYVGLGNSVNKTDIPFQYGTNHLDTASTGDFNAVAPKILLPTNTTYEAKSGDCDVFVTRQWVINLLKKYVDGKVTFTGPDSNGNYSITVAD